MSGSPHKVIPINMTKKMLKTLEDFLQNKVGRILDMRTESGRLIYSILTQISLRGRE